MTFDKDRLLTKWFLLCSGILSRRSRSELLRNGTTLCSFAWIAIIIPGLIGSGVAFLVTTYSAPTAIRALGLLFLMMAAFAIVIGSIVGIILGIVWPLFRSYEKHGVVFVVVEYGRAAKGHVCPLVKFK